MPAYRRSLRPCLAPRAACHPPWPLSGQALRLAHEALTRPADERDRLGEEHAHRVAESDRLPVGGPFDLQLRERRRGQLDRGVQGQRRELLALRLLHRLGLLLGELAQSAQEIFRVAAEGESETAASFHVEQASNAPPPAALRRRER